MNITNNDLKKIKKLFVGYSIYQEYFHNVAIANCDFKVFANERVEKLYYLFVNIFNKFPEEQLENFQPKGNFINIDYINEYKNEINGKKVLLVDDFIVDANIVNKNIQKLQNGTNKVKTWCLFCDATILDDTTKEIKDSFNHVIYNKTWEMRIIVQRINNVFNYLGVKPNYNGIEITSNEKINNLLGEKSYYLKNDERIHNYDSNKLIVSFYDKNNILKENGIKFIIRLYQNKNEVKIIPTLIFPNIDKKNIIDYCQNILSKFNLSINSNDPDECYKNTINQLNNFLLDDYLTKAQSLEKKDIEEIESNQDIKKSIYDLLYNNDKFIDFNSLVNNITRASNFDEKDVIIQLIMLLDENKLSLQNAYLSYGTEIKKTILFYRIIYELYPNATILFGDSYYDKDFFQYCALYMFEHHFNKEYLNLLHSMPNDIDTAIEELLSLQEFIDDLNCNHSLIYSYSKMLRDEYYNSNCKIRKLKK